MVTPVARQIRAVNDTRYDLRCPSSAGDGVWNREGEFGCERPPTPPNRRGCQIGAAHRRPASRMASSEYARST